MFTRAFISSLIVLGSISFTSASAINSPSGTYLSSCTAINVKNDSLSATCEKLNGVTQSTTLNNLSQCLNSIQGNGDIGNINGNLICIPDLPKYSSDFTFPKPETTINKWIYAEDTNSQLQHAWGVWAGLTQNVGIIDNTAVRAFETWSTPTNMLYRIENNESPQATLTSTQLQPSNALELSLPNQFRHSSNAKEELSDAFSATQSGASDTSILVSVAYNPPATQHTVSNKLLLQSTLNNYLAQGYTDIPDFPNNSITIKPVYKVIPQDVANGIYTFPGWPGTPSPAKAFPESDWGACVYVDVNAASSSGNSIDVGCASRSAENTFAISDFIHSVLSAEDAKFLNTQLSLNAASAGDTAILVGMHITTREIKRWTWQSVWWSASPDSPLPPSSAAIASQRPSAGLDAAAKHYAMTTAYHMVSPPQPIMSGQSVGTPVIAYNPHLEAHFNTDAFQEIRSIDDNGTSVINQYGVETNCMTCHNLAQYNPNTDYATNGNREKPYGTDYYMSINDPLFKNSLRLDFAWSILGNLKLDNTKDMKK